MKRRYSKAGEEASSYWLSIGDLMASVLIVFILIFVYQVLDMNEKAKKQGDIITILTDVKIRIIEKLNGDINQDALNIIVDPKTGAIKLDERVLFSVGEHRLKPEGKQYLRVFIPAYTSLLLSDPDIKNQLSQIIVEGHTDDVGSYMFNLDLSQKRAFAVVNFIFSEMGYFPYKEELKKYITANGRSYMKPILNPRTRRIDRGKSRRVEFQFKLKEDEALEKIHLLIKEGV